MVLRDEGFVVLWHDRGLPGLAAAAKLRPQVILFDVGLPDTDGRAVLRVLRATRTARRNGRDHARAYCAACAIGASAATTARPERPASAG